MKSGAFLWECLCDTTKHAELVKKLAGHYQLEESDFPMLEEDVTLFLNQLTSFDILKVTVILPILFLLYI